MNSQVKHRLVGALVIFCLAVIFSPLLFDFSPGNRIDRTTQVPVQPLNDLDPIEVPDPIRVEGVQAAERGAQIFIPPEEAVELSHSGNVVSVENPDLFVEPMEAAVEEVDSKTAVESVPTTTETFLNSAGLPNAWVIQAGAFSEQARAEQFRDDLIAKQWKAYSEKPGKFNDALFRVFVGPFISESQAEEAKTRLDTELNTKTKILKFQP